MEEIRSESSKEQPLSAVRIYSTCHHKTSQISRLFPSFRSFLLRSYYRCTNLMCGVKKRVERSSSDPTIVVTTYEGQHTHANPAVSRGGQAICAASLSSPFSSSAPLLNPTQQFHYPYSLLPHHNQLDTPLYSPMTVPLPQMDDFTWFDSTADTTFDAIAGANYDPVSNYNNNDDNNNNNYTHGSLLGGDDGLLQDLVPSDVRREDRKV